jgi:predicted nucleotidyltransferase
MTEAIHRQQIQLTDEELAEVRRILRRHVPGCRVWAFGSRVRGNHQRYSDLDIAVLGKKPLSLKQMDDLVSAFDESDLVFKVDVVDWTTASDAFRRLIEAEKVVLQVGDV